MASFAERWRLSNSSLERAKVSHVEAMSAGEVVERIGGGMVVWVAIAEVK